jgi:hypothetical protein
LSLDDVPFNIKHHRVQKYLSNAEGLTDLSGKPVARLKYVSA